MARKRISDPPGARTRYRTNRFVQEGKGWYFCTREGTIEGPFEGESRASEGLQVYLQVLNLNLLTADSGLTIAST
ncbi:MAG TPA: hypothetical protein ENH48_10000 [Halieaceae bacterium]|nr:MAG: hypothetical protein DRQ98_05330 [Gammaproteobacteria bacterium]HDY83268.1 hypothetical protein [Halieaceae bacterium]